MRWERSSGALIAYSTGIPGSATQKNARLSFQVKPGIILSHINTCTNTVTVMAGMAFYYAGIKESKYCQSCYNHNPFHKFMVLLRFYVG